MIEFPHRITEVILGISLIRRLDLCIEVTAKAVYRLEGLVIVSICLGDIVTRCILRLFPRKTKGDM